tara:strand:- start:2844 stop:4157 length:1314 start_codon:yes stop_codon:yes gene_type:complete
MTRKNSVNLSDTIESWRTKHNSFSDYVGEPDNLTTVNKTDLVQALNEIDANTGDSNTRSLFSLVKTGAGTYITPSYDSNSGIFSFQVDAIGTGHVADLDAGDVTTGQFNINRIPNLDGTKINSGTVNASYLPAVSALSGAISGTQLAGSTSDNLPEGSTNLFLTDSRVWTSLTGDSSINIDPLTGQINFICSTTQANAIRSGAAGVSAGTGITLTGSTLSIGQPVGTSSAVSFGNISGNAISGTSGTFSGALSGGTVSGNMLATSSDATTGTDNTKIMTALRVKNAIDNVGSTGIVTTPAVGTGGATGSAGSLSTGGKATRFISGDVTTSTGTSYQFNHNLGDIPDVIKYYWVLNPSAADGDYSNGDIIDFAPGIVYGVGQLADAVMAPTITSAYIMVRIGNSGPGRVHFKSSGGVGSNFLLDVTKWKLRIVATKIL